MATIEFTEEDERELGSVLGRIFPNKTYPLLVRIIRDAILEAPKFSEKIRELVAEAASSKDDFDALSKRIKKLEEQAAEPAAEKVAETPAEPEPETAVEPESQNDKDEEPTTAPPSPRRRTTTTKPATQAAEPKKDLASRVSAPPD